MTLPEPLTLQIITTGVTFIVVGVAWYRIWSQATPAEKFFRWGITIIALILLALMVRQVW